MSVDLVLFDLDDVLVQYDHGTRCRVLGERIGCDAGAVHEALFVSGLEREADLGLIDADTQARRLAESLQQPVDVTDCIAARAASMSPNMELLDLVAALVRRCRLAILSNNGMLVRDHFASLCPPLAPFFDGYVHCSAMYGIGKPEPEIFLRCAAALNIAPERVLFIDDKSANVLGAERAGMIGHHYIDPDVLRTRLSQLKLLEPIYDAS